MTKELLKQCLIGAEQAHAAFEQASGKKDPDWPEFYANFMFARLKPSVGLDDSQFVIAHEARDASGLMGDAYCGSPAGWGDPGCEL